MTLSPIQLLQNEVNQKKRNELLTKMAKDLLDIHNKFVSKLEEVNNTISKKVGPKGEKGTKGDKGETLSRQEVISIIKPYVEQTLSDQNLLRLVKPFISDLKDKHVPSSEELLSLMKPLIPQIQDGKDGKTPTKGIDYLDEQQIEELIKKHISSLEERSLGHIEKTISKRKIQPKDIDGFDQTVSAKYNQLKARGGYLHGGGVPSLTAGSGVTLTPKSDGGFIVGSSGGSGYQVPTGTVNGVNTVFVFTSAPNAVCVDGIIKRKTQSDGTVNWTGTTTITLTVAPAFECFAVA